MENLKKQNKFNNYLLLHTALLVYSFSGFFSKSASAENFLSFRYCCFYAGMLMTLFIYALIWQQAIKHINLTTAFANKGITVVWALIIGRVFFEEEINLKKIIGTIVIIAGIIIMVTDDGK